MRSRSTSDTTGSWHEARRRCRPAARGDGTEERREQPAAEPPQQVRGDSSGNDRIFLVVAETGRLRTAQRETDGSPQALLASLFEGPTDEDLEEGLRSALDLFDFRT